MKEIWLVCSGCCNDVNWHGFFETEQEAKDYCEWHNKYTSDDWNQVWYCNVNSMSFKNEKENNKAVYRITIDEYEIEEDEIEVVLGFNPSNRYVYDGDSYRFYLDIVCDNKDKAIKIAQDVLAQIKDKYTECEDWNLAMESVGGFVL